MIVRGGHASCVVMGSMVAPRARLSWEPFALQLRLADSVDSAARSFGAPSTGAPILVDRAAGEAHRVDTRPAEVRLRTSAEPVYSPAGYRLDTWQS